LEKSKTQETEPSSNRIANHSRQQVQIYTNATPLTYLICDCPFSTSKTVMQEIEITHIKGPIRRDTLNFF
jgi:predicted GIY-YIG superfamily endonuclease